MAENKQDLPLALLQRIESGVWPASSPNDQEYKSLLGKAAAQRLSAENDRIVLMTPPFHTIADEVRGGNTFWTSGVTNATQIDYEKALIIADFGAGSDSPIVLYYGVDEKPSVMYLRWMGDGPNIHHQWVETHACFDDFATAVGLDLMAARLGL